MEQAVAIEQPTGNKGGRPRRGKERLGRQKIGELVAKGLQSPAEIAEEVGVSPQAAQQQLAKYIKDVQSLEGFKKHRADILADKQRRVLDEISDQDIKKASLRDKAIFIGTMFDKERLERGESTTNMAGIVKVLQAADLPS